MKKRQEEALKCYDSCQRERMERVIKAIADGRLIYIRFFDDNDKASFYFKGSNDMTSTGRCFLYCFDTEQTSVILMGCLIDITSFGL